MPIMISILHVPFAARQKIFAALALGAPALVLHGATPVITATLMDLLSCHTPVLI